MDGNYSDATYGTGSASELNGTSTLKSKRSEYNSDITNEHGNDNEKVERDWWSLRNLVNHCGIHSVISSSLPHVLRRAF